MRTSHRPTPRLRHPLVAVLLFVLALAAVPAVAAAPATATAPSSAAPAAPRQDDRPIVLVGMTGVRWDDASA
ncbi:MAG: hypothetical protein LPK92_10210, partial [Actinomycetes bacterium]|nr:hypothetical protein [Actinomycetes bacterium]MDX5400078.1 hypothetical protein [Actinomycetes bacterium]